MAAKDAAPKEKDAAVQEADPKPVTCDWNGVTWDLPGPTLDDAPAVALVAMEQGKAMSFVEAILGPKQWRRFAAGSRTTGRDAAELMKAVLEGGYGLNLGG
jgi:hypothetical protein